jgi:protein-disulfide isomerase
MKSTISAIFLAATLAIGLGGLSACSSSAAEKANHQVQQMNMIAAALSREGIVIDVSGKADSSRAIPTTLSANDLLAAHEYLTQYVALGQSVLGSNVKMKHADTGTKLQNGIDDANSWLAKTEKRMSDLRAKQTTSKKK